MIRAVLSEKLLSPKPLDIRFMLIFLSLVLALGGMQSAKAEGVFLEKKKDQHQLSGADLNRIKAEYQIRFGKKASSTYSYQSSNPWEKKKSGKVDVKANEEIWAECRDYALHKRNRCYREGRDAYKCEQMYEARTGLCDAAP